MRFKVTSTSWCQPVEFCCWSSWTAWFEGLWNQSITFLSSFPHWNWNTYSPYLSIKSMIKATNVTIAHCFSRSWEHPQRRPGRGSWRIKTLWLGTSHCMRQSHSVCMHQGGRDHNDVIQLHMCNGDIITILKLYTVLYGLHDIRFPHRNEEQPHFQAWFSTHTHTPYAGLVQYSYSYSICWVGSVLILVLHMLGWFSTHTHTPYAGLVQYSYSYTICWVGSVLNTHTPYAGLVPYSSFQAPNCLASVGSLADVQLATAHTNHTSIDASQVRTFTLWRKRELWECLESYLLRIPLFFRCSQKI